jgi:hypothetical protein
MFTHTGLQDKPGNHLTHFVGVFLRPRDFGLKAQNGNGTTAVAETNGKAY